MIFVRHSIAGGVSTPITICPLGDIQWNGEPDSLAYGPLTRHIERCLSLPNPWFVGMGDYIDFASPSNRAALASARLYAGPRRVIDSSTKQLVQEVFERVLKPTRGRWAGMLSGHHFYPLQEGGNSDIKLCEMLKAPYLGNGGAIIQFEFRSLHKGRTEHINVWAHHGTGNGMKVGSALAKLENIAVAYEDVDIMLMGHQTKRPHAPILRLRPDFSVTPPRYLNRDVHLVATGGWEKGYIVGTPDKRVMPSYVEESIMTPTSLGAPIVHCRPAYHRPQDHTEWRPNITVEV